MANSTGKIMATLFDKFVKQMDDNDVYIRSMDTDSISPSDMQNASNVYWRGVEQQRPVLTGWDLTGQETGIIEQYYPATLSDPKNDLMQIRIDDLRDEGFMNRALKASVAQQKSTLNKTVADLVASTGSLYYESNSIGYDFVAEADTLMTERQCDRGMGASFFINPRTAQVQASDLAGRETLKGTPDSVYKKALINEDIASFKVLRAPTYGSVTARANATTSTVASDVLEVPRGYQTVGGVDVNVDYRYGTVSLVSAANYQVGDVITFAGVNALGLMDKTDTNELMTFKIIAIDTNDLTIYPKPIAADQAGITTEQAAYANISTAIVTGMAVSKVNAVGGQANSYWADDSICIINGDSPVELLNEFAGMRVESEELSNGLRVFMAYDAGILTMNTQIRLFTWYGVVNKDPSRNGVAIYTP